MPGAAKVHDAPPDRPAEPTVATPETAAPISVPTADALRLLPAGWEFARIEGRQLDELSRQQWISPAAERTSNALWC